MRPRAAGECRRLAQLAVSLLVFCLAPKARAAAPGLWFEVTRTPDAAACPDARRLAQTVESLFDARVVRLATSAREAVLSVAISIARSDTGYTAALRVENERWSERHIVDRDPDCRGLPEALAVAVVLLIEPHAEARRREQNPGFAASASPRPPSRPRATHFAVEGSGLFGTGLLGDLGSPTFGAALGASVSHGGPGFRLRGMRLLRRAQPHAPGTVELDAWSLAFGPCWRFGLPRGLALWPCVELGLGQQRAEARGFVVNDGDAAPWRVLLTGVTLVVPLAGPLHATGLLGGAVRMHRQNYFIDDELAEIQPRFAPFFGLGLSLAFKIGDGG